MKRSILVFLTLIFLSPSVFAVDYYWTRSGTSTPQIIDPVADCRALDPSSSYSYHSHSFAGATGQSMTCRFQRTSDGNLGGADYYYNRNGSTCPIDTTYNQSTGVCEGPQPTVCEADAGRTFPYSKTGTWPDAFITVQQSSGGLFYGTQQTACSSGCQISVISPACKVGTDGSYTCRGEALTTGAECVAGTGNSTDPGDPTVIEGDTTLPPPAPETIVDQIPCAYGLDSAVGGLKCISSNSVEKEGTTCGIFNGVNVCTTKQPVNDTTTIETTIVDTANPDGTTTTTKTDKATKTTCVGAKCESKESTTSTNTTKDGNGSTTSTSTTCLGEACIGNSETGGDTGGECLTDCEVSSSLELPSLDEAPSFGATMTGFIDDIQEAQMIQAVSNLNFPSGGNCSIPTAQTDVIGTLDFNIFCDMAPQILDPLEAIFLVFWGFLAIRVLLSA
jgi:hypothetical protein